MAKVKCKVCAKEVSGMCSVKKTTIKLNKKRKCNAYVYDEAKLKTKTEIPVTKMGYRDMQEAKARFKREMRELRRMAKEAPKQGTAENLGLIVPEEKKIIKPGDVGFNAPRDTKHPMTGDLSRFMTTAVDTKDHNKNSKR